MANITHLTWLLLGVHREVDISANTLVVGALSTGTNTLTDAILGNLIALQNGTDFSNGTNAHTHDGRYFTQTQLQSATGGSSGSMDIGDDNSYTNYTPLAATVKSALTAIDTALGASTTSANRTLSNLNSPTAVNQNLQPDGDGTRLLGAASFRWLALYAETLKDASSVVAVDVTSRLLKNSSGVTAIDFSTNGTVSFNGQQLSNVADPSASQDAVTLAYMNARLQGLKPKQSVRAASTANITIASALINGSVIDGVTVATGDRILLKNQTSAAQNGIYLVVVSGAASRSTDFDSLSPVDEVNGAWVAVQEGTIAAGMVFVQFGTVATLGTDPINFETFNPIAGLIGGDMITFAGSTFSVDLATASGLESTNPGNVAGQLRVKLEATNPTLKFTGSNELAVKLDAAGALASGASGLAVQVDNSSIEINTNALRIKALGVTLGMLAAASVDENKIVSTTFSASGAITGGSGSKVAWVPDNSSLEISSNAGRIKTTAYDQNTITGGSGSAAAVQNAPAMKRTLVAGQAFSANTSYAVRWGVTANGETAGRVYAADTTTSSFDLFYVIGMASSGSAVSAGQNIVVTSLGAFALSSSDTAFGSGTDGAPVFLTAAGTFSTTAPTTAGLALTRIGMVQLRSATNTANIIDVAPHVVGVN